jgi:hypothetical protein
MQKKKKTHYEEIFLGKIDSRGGFSSALRSSMYGLHSSDTLSVLKLII